MKYAVEMSSGAIIYIPSFVKIGSGIRKLIGGGYTDSMVIAYTHFSFLLFQNKESMPKITPGL
jgi:hypothetical protein